jgi:AcrR family transcriptional regulator
LQTSLNATDTSRRDAILSATVDEVVKFGFDGTSIQRIAQAAGVSTGLVMYHFKSKEELVTAAWVAAVKHFSERVTGASEGLTGLRRMENSYRILFVDRDEETSPWDLWLELWAKAARSPQLRELHAQQLAHVRKHYTDNLIADLDDMRPGLDPELAGDLLHTLVYGLAVKVTLDSELIPPERALQIGKLAIELLRKPPSGDDNPQVV